MKNLENLEEKLKAGLAEAYKLKKAKPLGEQWVGQVMQDIRSLEPVNEELKYEISINQMIWRFSLAPCVILIFLAFVSFETNISLNLETAVLISFVDPVNFALP